MDTKYYKKKIEEELKTVEKELKTVGRRKPENLADWEATPAKMNVDSADQNEVADSIEEFEDHAAILKQLEIRYNELKDALKRMGSGTYGICGVCKTEIEKERLEANPAATTCKKHLGK